MNTTDYQIEIIKPGLVEYTAAYEMQKKVLEQIKAGTQSHDALMLLEHPAVFTIGSGGSRDNILVSDEILEREGIAVHKTNRGGDITYHGPGQIVGYPILDLRRHKKDIHWYIRHLEEVLIRVIAEYGIEAGRINEFTGVWVGNEKIAAIGIGVSHWITFHGFAFNINPKMEHFGYIIPCGIVGKGVTSLSRLLGREIDFAEVEEKIVRQFTAIFDPLKTT